MPLWAQILLQVIETALQYLTKTQATQAEMPELADEINCLTIIKRILLAKYPHSMT